MIKQIKIKNPVLRGTRTLEECQSEIYAKYPDYKTDPVQETKLVQELSSVMTFEEALAFYPQS